MHSHRHLLSSSSSIPTSSLPKFSRVLGRKSVASHRTKRSRRLILGFSAATLFLLAAVPRREELARLATATERAAFDLYFIKDNSEREPAIEDLPLGGRISENHVPHVLLDQSLIEQSEAARLHATHDDVQTNTSDEQTGSVTVQQEEQEQNEMHSMAQVDEHEESQEEHQLEQKEGDELSKNPAHYDLAQIPRNAAPPPGREPDAAEEQLLKEVEDENENIESLSEPAPAPAPVLAPFTVQEEHIALHAEKITENQDNLALPRTVFDYRVPDDGISVSERLRFTNRTLLNYFHLHKTGGVTTKAELMYLIDRKENIHRLKYDGKRMRYAETCYTLSDPKLAGPTEESSVWRCDFDRILSMSPAEKARVDVVLGHQYWNDGCEMIFGDDRDIRHFSIFRHPLPRKLSFFYHFLVRNEGRDQEHVTREEVVNFVLGRNITTKNPMVRDAGPNYFASRLLSNGLDGFQKHRYEIPQEKRQSAVDDVTEKLRTRYAFIGLQLQSEASQCMLQKTLKMFCEVHGIRDMFGFNEFAQKRIRLNSGKYKWTAEKLWASLSHEQRLEFYRVEEVDLAIYDAAVKHFKKDIKMFDCEHLVDDSRWDEDIFAV